MIFTAPDDGVAEACGPLFARPRNASN